MQFVGPDRYVHGGPQRSAVVLINLGTPQAPTSAAVRRYLREFLSDPRVIELPRWLWWPILYGPVLALRPPRSAAKYAAVWTAEGSPLLVYSQRQAAALGAELARRGLELEVALAMRYGQPSIGAVLQQLRARQVTRMLMLPLYPQYSATSTGSAVDGVNRVLSRLRDVPEVRWIKHFADEAGYIEALRASVAAHWERYGRGECLLMSFQALGLQPGSWRVSFQSRFGRARWLEPSTVDTLRSLARGGVRRLDVICPGFVADCLETLEEIAIEGQATFLQAGGQQLRYIACLNDGAAFIGALADLVERNTLGWPVDAGQQERQSAEARRSAELAVAMGAPR
jgi:protoporphyrin/coproporphyrin ferrochelatase